MPKRQSNYHGLLIVDKPGRTARGLLEPPALRADDLPTSHDVVQMARRWSQQRRVGHTGTLDPMASGVLVLCLGRATRLSEYYQNHDKEYVAEICLGVATDTYDATGQVTARSSLPRLTEKDIEAVLVRFHGEILQAPPLFSALKYQGERLYRKARRKEQLVVNARKVIFHTIDLLSYAPPDRLKLRIICSAGTYIRSLAHDIGQAFGTHAYLDHLRREAAGLIRLRDAHTVQTIEEAASRKNLSSLILPVGAKLSMPTISPNRDELQRLGFGQSVKLQTPPELLPETLALALDQNEGVAGVIRLLERAEPAHLAAVWKAEKWLVHRQC